MNDPGDKPIQVLLVDDDRTFLETVGPTLMAMSEGSWVVHTTADAGMASALLKKHPIDLIVLDVRMPEISGLQLMGILHREYPTIPKVFLTALAEENERVAGLQSGAEMFLEKPLDAAGLQSIFATLNELVKWHRRRSSRETLNRATLLDLVKLECTSGHSRRFEVFGAHVQGQIYVKEGAIVHAVCPGRRGQSAFTYMAAQTEVEFELRQFVEPPERSIYRQWEFLFLEAVQLREQLQQAALEAQARAPGPTLQPEDVAPAASAAEVAPPPSPAAPPAEAPSPPPPTRVSDEVATRELFHRRTKLVGGAAPLSSPAGEAVPAPPASPTTEPLPLRLMGSTPAPPPAALEKPVLKSAPAGPAVSAEAPAQGVKVEELLVSTHEREVLYEWQCRAVESRLRLVDTVRERGERICQHLPAGSLDRLELQAEEGRMVIQFQSDGSVLLRSNTGVARGAGGAPVVHPSMAAWLDQQSAIRGLFACGVLRPAQPFLSRSVVPEYPREPLSVAWRCLQELFQAAAEAGFRAWQLRLLYDETQLYVAERTDGMALAMFLSKDPSVLDVAAVERAFNEFKTLEAS